MSQGNPKEIFLAALETKSPEDREAFLSKRAGTTRRYETRCRPDFRAL